MSQSKCIFDDLLHATVSSLFATLQSNDAVNKEESEYQRRIVTKIVEEEGDNPDTQEVKDEHNIKFIQNLMCTEDNGLFVNWNAHFID